MTTEEAIVCVRQYHGFRHPAIEAALLLAREVERLQEHHRTLAVVCRRMHGPCICGCHLSTTMEQEP